MQSAFCAFRCTGRIGNGFLFVNSERLVCLCSIGASPGKSYGIRDLLAFLSCTIASHYFQPGWVYCNVYLCGLNMYDRLVWFSFWVVVCLWLINRHSLEAHVSTNRTYSLNSSYKCKLFGQKLSIQNQRVSIHTRVYNIS